MILELLERFWAKTDRKGLDECWPWTGSRVGRGYGQMSSGSAKRGSFQRVLATHIALAITGHSRPSAVHVAMHSCDNPCCVNPAHLSWGLPVENMQDMWSRGRAAAQVKAAADMDARAAELSLATARNRKLSDDDVREIRKSTERTCDLARRYGVSWSLIDNVRQRKAQANVRDHV